ncbi:hypothetical protein F8M41_019271 [Gigaspora margarita]|uniref:Uncharacterized protein n=1 Tax=Gigaspora margarita TaxID=4874 RepID=A0A8H4AKB9_GIGMA|nr:hypothetical protein F8M41_019271 [Gigaspora margarita]
MILVLFTLFSQHRIGLVQKNDDFNEGSIATSVKRIVLPKHPSSKTNQLAEDHGCMYQVLAEFTARDLKSKHTVLTRQSCGINMISNCEQTEEMAEEPFPKRTKPEDIMNIGQK